MTYANWYHHLGIQADYDPEVLLSREAAFGVECGIIAPPGVDLTDPQTDE